LGPSVRALNKVCAAIVALGDRPWPATTERCGDAIRALRDNDPFQARGASGD
jgi:hypothetical protein